MASDEWNSDKPDYDKLTKSGNIAIKVICLGDSAVGKSKLVERFLINGFQPKQLSTYALTLYQHKTVIGNEKVTIDFWDTAGQEHFKSMHPSYYHQAHACILVFDVTRKITYKNLTDWYKELREFRPEIPCFCAANKIDVDYKVTQKGFQFPKKHNIPLYFVSASDGTNVVKLFNDAIKAATQYKKNPSDFTDEILKELEGIDDSECVPYDEDEDLDAK